MDKLHKFRTSFVQEHWTTNCCSLSDSQILHKLQRCCKGCTSLAIFFFKGVLHKLHKSTAQLAQVLHKSVALPNAFLCTLCLILGYLLLNKNGAKVLHKCCTSYTSIAEGITQVLHSTLHDQLLFHARSGPTTSVTWRRL